MIADVLRERGPVTVAAFMELALYDPRFGYYARAPRRSGRAGDFFTSVDVGSVFGELLELQIDEAARLLTAASGCTPKIGFDLVEAGAGNGRLSADILNAARARHPSLYARTRLHLVEASAAARAEQRTVLGPSAERLTATSDRLPDSFEGVLIANELLDAMPVHQVVMREDGLKEVFVRAGEGDRCHTVEGPPSTPALEAYLAAAGARLEPGWRAEINLLALDWIRKAARRLRRGFVILIDYGHEARDLYSASHSAGTLTSFSRHTSVGPDAGSETTMAPSWLRAPGGQDLTAHVDFTSVKAAAEAEGLTTLGFLDQTYFLMGLLQSFEGLDDSSGAPAAFSAKKRMALKTLLMPGGLGSTQKVLIFGKGVGTPPLSGLSFRIRVT